MGNSCPRWVGYSDSGDCRSSWLDFIKFFGFIRCIYSIGNYLEKKYQKWEEESSPLSNPRNMNDVLEPVSLCSYILCW